MEFELTDQSVMVEYLGHVVNATGLHATPSKVKAIIEAPIPRDLT